MADNADEILSEAVQNPRQTSADGTTVQEHPLGDLVDALRSQQADEATQNKGTSPIRWQFFRPPGSI